MISKATASAAAAEYLKSTVANETMTKAQASAITRAYLNGDIGTDYEIVNRIAPMSILAATLRALEKPVIPQVIVTAPIPEIISKPVFVPPPVSPVPAPGYVPIQVESVTGIRIAYVPAETNTERVYGRPLQTELEVSSPVGVIGMKENESTPTYQTPTDIIDAASIETTDPSGKTSISLLIAAAVVFILYWIFGRRR